MALWMSQPLLLYRYGNLLGVPLFETWGMISYAPLLALRQFRAKQFLPAIARLVSLEITYGKPEKAQLLSQIMQTWENSHRTRLGQLIEGFTPKYTIGREQKIEDTEFFLQLE